MTGTDRSQCLYDADYYANNCGRPYQRDEQWLSFFGGIADQIVSRIAPATVLDAGCAMGFLVESLRDRGVQAFGLDISPYAIEQARDDIRAFCRVGSITEPLDRTYDLIVCIEVLEHLTPQEAEVAVANLCAHSDQVLFSSTPDDFHEATHVNVRPPEHWAELFARHGFYRDVDFDAGFITPWAGRFRRTDRPAPHLARDYERALWQSRREIMGLRAEAAQTEARAVQAEAGAAQTEARVAQIEARAAQAEVTAAQAEARAQAASESLNQILRSNSWALMLRLQAIRRLLAPAQSRRELLLRKAETAYVVWRRRGSAELGREVAWRLAGRPRPTASAAPPPASAYAEWIARTEPGQAGLDAQRVRAASLPHRPLFTLVTPVFNATPAVLRDTIESVLAQTYERWEWCLVDAGSASPEVSPLLRELAARDSRVKLTTLEANLGISANINRGLDTATGDFVLVLDHDDSIAPDLLYEASLALGAHSDAGIVYFDEDKVSADGRDRRDPWFKPERWSPDLLLSTNYWMHCAYRLSLLKAVGRFRPELDGAQDWDVALRCADRGAVAVHIPRVLYHWRQVPGSAAADALAKPWASQAQLQAIEEHLERNGSPDAGVSFAPNGSIRVRWPAGGARVSIIIPTKDNAVMLRHCLSSLLEKTAYEDYEVVLVDTGSLEPETARLYESLAGESRVRVTHLAGPFNYSKANNFGAAQATGSVLVFLNNDTQVLEPEWLDELAGWAQRPTVGAVGGKLLRPDGTIQQAGIIMGIQGHGSHVFEGCREQTYGHFGSSEWYRDYMAVTGACLAMRRDLFAQLNGFDEVYEIGFSDIDLCLRADEAGYRNVYDPFARLVHHEGATRGLFLPANDVLRAYHRMLGIVRAGDPYFNRNLSYSSRVPVVAAAGEEARDARLLRILSSYDLAPADRLVPDAPRARSKTKPVATGPAQDRRNSMLLVTHDLGQSGAPLMLQQLARSLAGEGYEVTVVSPLEGPLREQYEAAGVTVIVAPGVLNDARVLHPLLNPHTVLVANTILAWRSIYAAKAAGRPALWWIHESDYGVGLASQNQVLSRAFDKAAAVVFAARATADMYARFLRPEQSRVIPYGVESPQPAELAREAICEPSRLMVVCIASIEPRKGQDVLLKALQRLPVEVAAGIQVFLIGRTLDSDFHSRLQRMAGQMGNVHLVGEMPRSTAMSYLLAADALVLASRDEVLPVTLLEAMALGKGIVATRVGGVEEVLEDGVNALLVQPNDHRGMARQLQALAANRALSRALGEQARLAFDRNLTEEKFTDKMVALLEGLSDDVQIAAG